MTWLLCLCLARSGDSRQAFILLPSVCPVAAFSLWSRMPSHDPEAGGVTIGGGFWGGPRGPLTVNLSGLACYPGMCQKHPTKAFAAPQLSAMAMGDTNLRADSLKRCGQGHSHDPASGLLFLSELAGWRQIRDGYRFQLNKVRLTCQFVVFFFCFFSCINLSCCRWISQEEYWHFSIKTFN